MHDYLRMFVLILQKTVRQKENKKKKNMVVDVFFLATICVGKDVLNKP